MWAGGLRISTPKMGPGAFLFAMSPAALKRPRDRRASFPPYFIPTVLNNNKVGICQTKDLGSVLSGYCFHAVRRDSGFRAGEQKPKFR